MAEVARAQSTSPPRPAARPSWRGAAPQEAPRHRWQQGGQLAAGTLTSSRQWWRFRVGLLFALAAVLLAMLIWYLLYAPVQTPVVAIAATNYQWPLPPNAWAREDLQALTDLNGKTLQVADLSADWRLAERGLARLDEELKRTAQRQNRTQVFILYLSLHAAVDGAGHPCLIPPSAAPHDTKTWLPLSALLDRLRAAKLPNNVHKLLVIDGARQPINWHLGQLAGGFADTLPAAIAEAKIPNLAILTSAGPGETSIASSCLGGSVFGHYLRLGIAGAADQDDSVGDNNGRVSLQELREYLVRHVHRWVAHHRGVAAFGGPQVVPAEADFDVAWSLRPGQLNEMLETSSQNGLHRSEASIPAAKLTPLWTQLDRLRSVRPWRFDPIAWRSLEHRLLWLEELASAGKAYDEAAHSLLGELTSELNQAEERRIAAARGTSLPAHVAVLSREGAMPAVKVHSLPLAAFWGTVDPDKLSTLTNLLTQCQTDPSARNFVQTITAFEEAGLPATMEESQLLSLWQRLGVPSSWPDAQPLGSVLRAHADAQQRAVPLPDGSLPGDERAHTWVRAQLASLDRGRRELEDDALLGEARADGRIAAAESAAAGLENFDFDQRATSVFVLRDKLWAELPYLGAWLCRPQPDLKAQEIADEQIRQTLLPLLTDAALLERELERSEAGEDGADQAWTADASADAVRQKFEALHKFLQTAIAQLNATNDGPAAVRELDAVLAIPFLSWDTRQRLTQRRLEIEVKLAGSFDQPDGGAVKVEQSRSPAAPYVARAIRWQRHPLAALLGIAPADTANQSAGVTSPNSTEELAHLAQVGEQVRQHLASLTKGSKPAPPRFAPAGDQPLVSGLTSLCRAVSRTRRAAALWYEPPALDPVRELRRADLQQLLLWRAARALDDYYGPPRSGVEPLFAVAASDYLAAARALGPFSEAAATQVDELANLLAKRRVAAQEALAVTANDILLVDQSATVASSIEVRARSPEAAADLPAGTAAVFLADQSGRLGPASWPLVVPRPAAQASQTLLAEKSILDTVALKGRGPFVQAIATLRGNDFVAPVLLRAPGGMQVDCRSPVYGPPQVTVLGYEQKRASAVFILDCSHSMRAVTQVEAPDAAARSEASKMEVAKGALRALLTDLAERGNLRVGVRLFGHRVGWSTTESEKLLRQTGYGSEIPAELRPYADVEQVLPLGRFDSIAAGKVFDKLQTVRPWGESPLYLALQQAVAEFGPDDTAARSIVVITDGQNYQFNPPREFAPPLADVMTAAERARIAVHVVGFDVPAAEVSAARRDFEQIASRTGGSYVSVASATRLLETLERLLRPGEFRVTSADGTVIAEAELGHPAQLPAQQGRRAYDVAYEHLHEPIEVAGGEAVELAVRRGASHLEVVPYLKGNPRFETLVAQNDGIPTQLQAGIHRSVRTQDGVQFPISIQHAGNHFVPRPAEIWVEIEPLGLPPESDDGPYIFYDAPFAAGTTVPLANLLARSWPAAAARAEVRVWAKASSSTPAIERPLTEVADRLPEDGVGFTVPGVSGVTYQVRTAGANGQPLTVGLIERHDGQSAGVGSLKVTLSPPANQATHQFDPRNKLVLHTFLYNQSDERLSGRIMIKFTTRDSAHDRAWRAAQPVVVDVSGRSDVLELTPPTR